MDLGTAFDPDSTRMRKFLTPAQGVLRLEGRAETHVVAPIILITNIKVVNILMMIITIIIIIIIMVIIIIVIVMAIVIIVVIIIIVILVSIAYTSSSSPWTSCC